MLIGSEQVIRFGPGVRKMQPFIYRLLVRVSNVWTLFTSTNTHMTPSFLFSVCFAAQTKSMHFANFVICVFRIDFTQMFMNIVKNT